MVYFYSTTEFMYHLLVTSTHAFSSTIIVMGIRTLTIFFSFIFFSFIFSDFTLLFLYFFFTFSLLYFLGKTMKKACDKEVT